MAARLKRKRSKSQIQSLNEESVVSDILLEPIIVPEFRINLGLPAVKLEYCDGSGWYPLASESWVTTNAPGTVTSISAGTGLTGGTITSSGTISIASVGITPGSYNWPNSLTINAQGQVTGANAGSQPITSIISNSGLTVTTSNGQSLINIFNTGVTSGTYNWPASFSVNAIGQLTSVTASGSLPINRLSGYPSSSSVFLRGDGSWASPTSSSIDINTGTTGQLSISRLNGYPSSSNAFLRGDGSWMLPYINNLNINGTVSLLSYGLTTSGNVNATTGSLIGNNLASYNSSSLNVQSPIAMGNNRISNLQDPINSQDAVTKSYTDLRVDKYQTLSFSSSLSWDTTLGNVAFLTLSSNCAISSISWSAVGVSTFTLFVKQDSTGNRTLNIHNIYRPGSTSTLMPLSTAANAVDCLIFKLSGEAGKIYLVQVINNFQFAPAPPSKFMFDYTGSTQTLTIQSSATNTCRVKVLGGGGGQGLYSAGSGSSGAGGYTVYLFNTSSYIGQTLYIKTGQGGEGGISVTRAGAGGWPNGGMGISGDTYPGGGGGRSEVRIGSSGGTILAVAGGGGGGSGFTTNGLGAGGGTTGQDGVNPGTGGTQSAGGVSAPSPPSQFIQAGFSQGAGATTTLTNLDSYDTGGGGDGYFGGGCSGSDGRTSGGGSGYVNTSFSGYSSGTTYQGSGMAIPSIASSDSDFSGGYGIGQPGAANTGSGLRGGVGRIVIEFI
jgi:hypothetical protein